jgi:hypothetical protein
MRVTVDMCTLNSSVFDFKGTIGPLTPAKAKKYHDNAHRNG